MNLVTSSPPSLDVRTLTGPDRCQTVLGEFDRLRPGETMIVVSGHRPAKLLGHLQADRRGLFEWSPLEDGPEVWRTEIARRDAPLGAQRTVTEALGWDHDRLEAIFRRGFEARAARDYAGAREAFTRFDLGLRRHIRFEEEILFPAFEEWAELPSQGGPTGVMRAEHREIEAILEALRAVVDRPGRAADTLREDLERVLGGHNVKEENVLYPGTDKLLDADERDALVRRIQAS
jgi:regulator of cell morphogenesis and NO signaling